jgi:hypothetical protein
MAVVEPVLRSFGLASDPSCWIVWGDDPSIRWTIIVPASAGLVTCVVRVNVPGEGPRVSAKLARWNRVQTGELAAETSAGHRLVTFQVEGLVLRGADADADRIAALALAIYDSMDGRPLTDLEGGSRAKRSGGRTEAKGQSSRPTGRAPGKTAAARSGTKSTSVGRRADTTR